MKLKKLFKNIPVPTIKGCREVEITGISSHSKLTAPGNLFIAKKGKHHDGTHYIKEAIAAGAVAIVTDIYNPFIEKISQIIHPNPGQLEGIISNTFYCQPDEELCLIGITGTSGKTTTAYLTKQILERSLGPCGLLGTVEYQVGSNRYTATKTTPEAPLINKMLRDMVNQSCCSAVMEVTSHALHQHRVDCLNFDIALFTNLSHEHLDYHGDMENYSKAKQILFKQLNESKTKRNQICSKTAIVNHDNAWHKKMIEEITTNIVTYGIDTSSDLQASNIELTPQGTSFKLTHREQTIDCQIPFVGRFNVYNALAASAVAITCGVPIKVISEILREVSPVPGRLEPVKNALNVSIFVDFSHKPDALENALKTLHELKQGNIITVFGCGGDRDRSKRKTMGTISERYSSFTIITSDNPRSECPESIAAEIGTGFSSSERYEIIIDRSQAIKKAIFTAKEGDIILIAGKGHEQYQIFSHRTIEFDDKKEALKACQERELLFLNASV